MFHLNSTTQINKRHIMVTVLHLQAEGRAAGLVVLLECGPACSCSSSCQARPSQQGVALPLILYWSVQKVSQHML